MANYIVKDITETTERIKKEMELLQQKLGRSVSFSEYASASIDLIHTKAVKTGLVSLEDQHLIGAILGSMMHQAYCDSRKLDNPNENGLKNNPREKKLTSDLDKEFVQEVLSGKIPQSKTLYIKDGNVCMDIANTEFVNLSPYWQKDNYMAGKTAGRTVMTCWDGLSHKNEEVQKYVTIAVANGIHEAWISRDNIYYDEYNGEIFTNQNLDTAYVFLPDDEKAKDLEHVKMAMDVIGKLVEAMNKTKSQDEPTQQQPE